MMRRTVLVTALVFLFDQVTKYVVLHILDLDRTLRQDVLPPWISLRMAWNDGINFGLFSSGSDWMRWALIALALAICAWVWVWVGKTEVSPKAQFSAGLLIGGALGNVVDRIVYGAVADFLNMGFPGFDNPYSFNVADISIFLGAVGLALFTGSEKTA